MKVKEYSNLRMSRMEFEQLVWRRPQKEFELNEALYDIVQVERSADSVSILCYKDDHEKKLDTGLKRVMGDQNSDKSRSHRTLTAQLIHPFIPNPLVNIAWVHTNTDNPKKTDFFHYESLKSTPHLKIHSPPPLKKLLV